MPTLYVLIGLPGSGKSHWTQANADRLGAVVVGSDEVRAEFQAHGQNPHDGNAVFAEVERRARAYLQADRSSSMPRIISRGIARMRSIWPSNYVFSVWFDTSLAEALQRNGWRTGDRFGEQRVPDYIIRDMAAHGWGTVSGAGLEIERFLILRRRMFVSRVRETNSLQREIHNGLAHVCQTVDS